MREFLTNYVNETFKEFGVSTAQIEGETTEEIWENMHKKMEELIDEIGENEYKVEEAKVDRYLEEALDHFMETGLLPGQSVPLWSYIYNILGVLLGVLLGVDIDLMSTESIEREREKSKKQK